MSNENKPKTLKEIKELELLKIKNDTDEIIEWLDIVFPFFEINIPAEKINMLLNIIDLVEEKRGETDIDSMTKVKVMQRNYIRRTRPFKRSKNITK